MGRKRETHFNYMTVLSLNNTILMMCVWTNETMMNADGSKIFSESPEFSPYPLNYLKFFNIMIRLKFNKGFKLLENG